VAQQFVLCNCIGSCTGLAKSFIVISQRHRTTFLLQESSQLTQTISLLFSFQLIFYHESVMSFRLEHYRSSSTSQLVSRPSFAESFEKKGAHCRESRLSERGRGAAWRPWTLHPTALIATLIFTIGIMGILEYLQRVSDAEHGIIFASDRDAIPDTSRFLYFFLPTLIAVLYSTWWSWVDVDVKRLEPWY
jgi:Protein of unknown function (DUF3433)